MNHLNVSETLSKLCQSHRLSLVNACSNIANTISKNLSIPSLNVTSQTLYLILPEQYLGLRHLTNGPILILDKQSTPMYAVFVIILEYMNELYLSLLAFAVPHCLSRWFKYIVLVLRPLQNPLHILKWNLVVVGDKETLHGAAETFVKIQNSTIHMNENHVVVKKEAIQDGESKDNENG
jgi:hypothetical protein